MTVGRSNRFQPTVYWTGEDTPLEFGVIDTSTGKDVACVDTFMGAVEVAYGWTLRPERAANDLHGLILL